MIFLLLFLLHSASILAAENISILSKLEIKQSNYNNTITDIISKWSDIKPKNCKEDKNHIKINAYTLPEHEYYMAFLQKSCFKAPIDEVAKILKSFDKYSELFPDLKHVKVTDQKANNYLTSWKVRVPVFFLPNFEYQMRYLVEEKENTKIFRYHLVGGETMIQSDGVIILDKISDHETLFSEYDFYLADWGALKTFSPGRIWKDSLKGLYHSDLALKMKSENKDWDFEKSKEESEDLLDDYPAEEIVKSKSKYDGIQTIIQFNQSN